MARLKKVNTPEVVVENSTDQILEGFGLVRRDLVRFRRDADHWTKGKVMGVGKDGSLTIFDQDGRWRAIMPENVMVQEIGPRGGKHWRKVK